MFVPSCYDNGTYKEMQCHGSTGHCWCVTPDGIEIEGTRSGPGEDAPNCGGGSHFVITIFFLFI